MSGRAGSVSLRSPWPVRFLDEILLYSGQYALFYILMNFADQKADFFGDLGHASLFASLLLRGPACVRPCPRQGQDQEAHRADSELFGTYVGGRVRDRIISANGQLGEEKEVAILFSDIRDFTPLTERSGAVDVVEMLNLSFSEWDRVSAVHGGIIDKFIGDAVMILFEQGPAGDPARDAVRCGLAMLDGYRALRARMEERGLPAPSAIGVGIAYGPVILGNIGSDRRRNYTAIGDIVNTASRLEGACKEHGRRLIVSDVVHARLDPPLRASFSCLGDIPLKGKSGVVRAFGA